MGSVAKPSAVKSLVMTLLSSVCIAAIPLVTHAKGICGGGTLFLTQNVGPVTQNPYNACPANASVAGQCTTLTFSGLGPFSRQAGFENASCPGQLVDVTFTGEYVAKGFILGKYQVVGVYYAPPGAASMVTYGNNYSAGTTTSVSNSFTVANTVSIGVASITGTDSVTAAFGWGTGTTSSSSLAITSTVGQGVTVPGPASSKNGIDHSQDLIWIWLNPAVGVTYDPAGPVPVVVTSLNYDSSDPDQGADVYPLTVAELRTLAAGGTPPGVDMTRLARAWSPTGALGPSDYADILASDPFATNPNYNPLTDPTHRFDTMAQTINYTPAGSGGQPITTNYSASYTSTTTQGQSATDTHSVSIATKGGVMFDGIKVDLSAMTTWTWTNMWSQMLQSTKGQSASFAIVSPLPADNYTGPTAISIWKDNVYGSFMFVGEL